MHVCVVEITTLPSAVLISTVLGLQSVQFSNDEESVDVVPPSQVTVTGLMSTQEVNTSPRKANPAFLLIAHAIFSEMKMS